MDFDVQVDVILQRDEPDFLWFHPRATPVPALGPDRAPMVVMTLQKHLLVSDYYSGLYVMHSTDLGRTWTGPNAPAELGWTREPTDVVAAVADVTPGWHPPTGKILATGIRVRYDRNGQQLSDTPDSRQTAYTIYDPDSGAWTSWRAIELPQNRGRFFLNGSGCAQWIVAPDGTCLIPIYFAADDSACYCVTVLKCVLDGAELRYERHGTELELDVDRGVCEPSVVAFGGRCYMTLRNDRKGYVTVSDDGLDYAPIRPWCFDDGTELGSYNTQQHWLAHSDALFLVYTRRGVDNDHVMRHRAPLLIAEVDPERLCLRRDTERILIPEQGAPMGNFGATAITGGESWVTVSEFMWPAWNDMARARGAAGRTMIARLRWATPNRLT